MDSRKEHCHFLFWWFVSSGWPCLRQQRRHVFASPFRHAIKPVEAVNAALRGAAIVCIAKPAGCSHRQICGPLKNASKNGTSKRQTSNSSTRLGFTKENETEEPNSKQARGFPVRFTGTRESCPRRGISFPRATPRI